MERLDQTDRQILDIIQHNGRISNAKLAERIHLSAAATHKRLKRLEQENYIEGYSGRVNLKKLGYNMLVYVHISLNTHSAEELTRFRGRLRDLPEVLECSFVTGAFDYIAKVALKDQADLEHFILHKLTPIEGVSHVNTSLVVAEIKSGTVLPI